MARKLGFLLSFCLLVSPHSGSAEAPAAKITQLKRACSAELTAYLRAPPDAFGLVAERPAVAEGNMQYLLDMPLDELKKMRAWYEGDYALGVCVADLLIAEKEGQAAPASAHYPRAAEIKRACAAAFAKDEAGSYRDEEDLNAKIDRFSEGPIEEVRAEAYEWMPKGASPGLDCLLDQLAAHSKEGPSGLPAPRSAPVVGGTLAPTSSGTRATEWKQQGSDPRIIASDGESAMDCVSLTQLTDTDSGVSGGGRVLANGCSGEVEIAWCYSPGDCDSETGSAWTIQPGRSWPLKAEGEVRWAACHGRDTAGFVKGSHGLRYYCKAPAEK